MKDQVLSVVGDGKVRLLKYIRYIIVLTCLSIHVPMSALGADTVENCVEKQIKALADVHGVEYELDVQQENLLDTPQETKLEYKFKYWWQQSNWRAEKISVVDGIENPIYTEAFNGKNYQLLDYRTGKLTIATSAISVAVAPRHSEYDNELLGLFDFLQYKDKTNLPSYLEAAPLEEVLSSSTWKSFFGVAKIQDPAAINFASAQGVSYLMSKAHLGDSRYDNEDVIEFDKSSSLFPRVVERLQKNQAGTVGPACSIEVENLQPTQIAGISFPRKLVYKLYTNLQTRRLAYTRTIEVKGFRLNPMLDPSIFNVDLTLASVIWDVDNRVTLSVPAHESDTNGANGPVSAVHH
jgi:hypothetical protein